MNVTHIATLILNVQWVIHTCIYKKYRMSHPMRKGQARTMARVILMKWTPAGEKGGQEHTMRLSTAEVSSAVRYI